MPDPTPDTTRPLRLAFTAAAVLASLISVGITASGTTTVRVGVSQPFAPVVDMVVGAAASAADAAAAASAVAGPDLTRNAEPAVSRAEPPAADFTPQIMATAAGVEIVTPSPEVRLIGFHQSGVRSALAWEPRGTPFHNGNAGRYRAPPATEGPRYAIMANRRRPTHPTTAVDVAVPHNTTLTSPVTGTVAEVKPYLLYGRYPDMLVTVVPDGRPDLRVVMMHLNAVRVAPGQRVEAGKTVLAPTAMPFPFQAQIEHFSGRMPHLHIELRRVG